MTGNNFVKKNWFYLIVSVFIILNIIFFISNNINKKTKASTTTQQDSNQQIQARNPVENSDFYNRPCPELSLTSIDGDVI
ncbi:MAG: hypothetical protein MUP98_06620, partial [Candidatus Aminicenantes bacterium]|nr:hypothetical protein [Candidatus Aminicenantes bacterium]